jgi:hypothetical protein
VKNPVILKNMIITLFLTLWVFSLVKLTKTRMALVKPLVGQSIGWLVFATVMFAVEIAIGILRINWFITDIAISLLDVFTAAALSWYLFFQDGMLVFLLAGLYFARKGKWFHSSAGQIIDLWINNPGSVFEKISRVQTFLKQKK